VLPACRTGAPPFVLLDEPGELRPPVQEERTMRFMILLKADKDTEAGVLPSEDLVAAMMKYNEELVNAGVMLAGEGLQASSKGARVRFSGDERSVVRGPFDADQLVAGFWMFETKSLEEAIAWVKRCPNPLISGEAEIEIRQVFEAEDLGEGFTPELREKEAQLREQEARLREKKELKK
jgi:hypothetical protein